MIRQTIFPRVNTHIPVISKSYRFNDGSATVQLDSLGNYEVLVNGQRFSSLENSAKRDADYKLAVNDVSLKMINAFEKRDSEFTSMHRKASRIQQLSDYQKRIGTLTPKRYEREVFNMPRPTREDIRRDLESEAAIRFPDLYTDRLQERMYFVNGSEQRAMIGRLQAYEEIQAFFNGLQDEKEAKANAAYQKEYESQKKEIEDFIKGENALTEKNIVTILGELSLPYRIEVSCTYDERAGLLNTDIELHDDMKIPTNKTSMLSTGKISVKEKLVRELTQFKTETMISMVYYIAASLFNATVNIRSQRISVWNIGKREGLIWIQFDRNRFSNLNMQTLNVMQDYFNWPHVDALKMVRGASQFETIDADSFMNAFMQVITDNHIDNSASIVSPEPMTTVSIGYAKTVAEALPNDSVIQSFVADAIRSRATKVILPQKYKGILNELRGMR